MDTLSSMPVEHIHANSVKTGDVRPIISILVPTFKYAPAKLVDALSRQSETDAAEFILYDDGSQIPDLEAQLTGLIDGLQIPAKVIVAQDNKGRAEARNRLIAEAKGDWLLFLDSDMEPDTEQFLADYLSSIESKAQSKPAVICGGFSVEKARHSPSTQLHRAQSLASECRPAAERQQKPGLSIFTSNVLVHRDVVETVSFDEKFSGWGWEDTDWGIRLAAAFPIFHTDNTATHHGLDEDTTLIRKYAQGAENFHRLTAKHPGIENDLALAHYIQKIRGIPAKKQIARVFKAFAAARYLPISLRLQFLKIFRVFHYAGSK